MPGVNFLDYRWLAVVIGSKASLQLLETVILLTIGGKDVFLLSHFGAFVKDIAVCFGSKRMRMKSQGLSFSCHCEFISGCILRLLKHVIQTFHVLAVLFTR